MSNVKTDIRSATYYATRSVTYSDTYSATHSATYTDDWDIIRSDVKDNTLVVVRNVVASALWEGIESAIERELENV